MTLPEAFDSYVAAANELNSYIDDSGLYTFKLEKYQTSYDTFCYRIPDPDLALAFLQLATDKAAEQIADKKRARLAWEAYLHIERGIKLEVLLGE